MVARTDRRTASKRLETMLLRRAFTHSRKRIWIVRRTFTTPARENRWPAIIYDVAAANESRATRIAESPLLATGRGWGTRRIYYGLTPTDGFLRCQTGWENREDRARHFQPLLLPPFLPRMRRYDTAINFPGSRALFHHSRRHFENSVERQFPRVYICISLRDEITYIFWRREGIVCGGGEQGFERRLFRSLSFSEESVSGRVAR